MQKHHVIYQQELRRIVRAEHKAANVAGPPSMVRELALAADKRNIVLLGFKCHVAHHNRSRVLPLGVLPDSVFVFASELLGAGAAFEYLRRRYAGEDARLDALLGEAV